DHDRAGDDALVLTGVPVLGHEAGVDEAGDVAGDGEMDVVGLEAILDRAALVAGGAVGVLELEVLAVLGLLELLEDRVVRLLGNGEADDRESLGVAVAAAADEDRCSDE